MTANSVIIAKAQIRLLREELPFRLIEAKQQLIELAAQTSDGDAARRLVAKADGVDFIFKFHLDNIVAFEGPTEVSLYCAEVAENIHTNGYGQGFTQGVDLALGYARGYANI